MANKQVPLKSKVVVKDKLRASLIKEYKNQFGNELEELDDSSLAEIPGWVTTGNYALNWIISKSIYKGLPLGRVVLLSGDPASGKSMIALSMMREPSIDLIVFIDTEGGGVNKDFAKFLGIDTKRVLYSTVDTIESLIERMKFFIDMIEKNKFNKNVLLVVDSISMLSTERELDPDAGADMGTKARLTRQFFRTYIRKMQKLKICAVFTAHLTQNIGGYGPPKSVSGGTILGYAPSVEIRFTKINADSDIEQSARGAQLVKIRAVIEKSRLGTTAKRVKLDLDMQYGLDPYAGLFDILRDYEFIITAAKDMEAQIEDKKIPKKSSGWWMFKPWKDDDYGMGSKQMFDKMIEEEITATGKFREKSIKNYCKEYDWFMPEIEKLLGKIYSKDLMSDGEKDEFVEDVKDVLINNKDPKDIRKLPPDKPKPPEVVYVTEGADPRKKNKDVVDIPDPPARPKGRIIKEGVDPKKQDENGNKIKKKSSKVKITET